ncbi:hypothetical protein BJ170DRAFT_639954 [Xylariales sp. AK1849]|nr:hypothetical protein BJ170DRAFT_639954 [Xylariales sp. AK1849]
MLEHLPSELVELVASFVDDLDILNLRQCCRQLHKKTWPAFGTAFFYFVPLDFCLEPLDRLRRIAFDENLRTFVHALRVGEICRGCHNPPSHPLGLGHQWSREPSGCLDTSSALIAGFKNMLTDRLVRCRAVSITDSCGNLPEQEGTDTSLSTTDVVYILLSAVSGVPFKSFRLDFKRMQPLMNPYQLPRRVVDSAIFRTSWAASLKDLRLGWYLKQDDLFAIAIQLVTEARALRSLQLDWSLSRSSPAFFRQLAGTPELPSVTHIRLSALRDMTSEILTSFLSRFKHSLQCLEISFTYLVSRDWSKVFSAWVHAFPHLQSVTVHLLPQAPGQKNWLFCPILYWPGVPSSGKFEFIEALIRSVSRVIGVRYRGKGEAMRSVLEGLAESVYHEHPIEPAGTGGEEKRFPNALMIAGKLRAEKVKRFEPIEIAL